MREAFTRLRMLVPSLAAATCFPTFAATPDLAGMWSDPPATAVDAFCFFLCTDAGIARLESLLDDPANDARTYQELAGEASAHQTREYFRPRLTEAALATSPLNPLEDRGYLYCEPWGFAKQIFAPHQLEIRQYADRVEMHYGEWDQRRTVYLDGRPRPQGLLPTPLGHSVGHYDGDTLVIETSGITANITPWDARHSEQLTAVERYRRPSPERLELAATISDPWSLREPLEIRKVWSFAPAQQIYAYDACEPAAKGPSAAAAPERSSR